MQVALAAEPDTAPLGSPRVPLRASVKELRHSLYVIAAVGPSTVTWIVARARAERH